jgi:SOS-response transcriptional repressor LexA
MQHKPPGYLSEIRRTDPRKLVDRGDSGLMRANGDCVDLHALLTGNSVHVKLVKVITNSMRVSGLHHGSIAVVDRGTPIEGGTIVHVRYNGDEIMRQLVKSAGQWFLQADDPRIQDVLISEDDIVERLGAVTAVIIFIQ